MKEWFYAGMALPLLVLLLALPGASEIGGTEQRIDHLFSNFHNNRSPGCAVAVVRDGKITYENGYGMADLDYGTPITPTSVFYIASNSKQFTAMSVALLAEQGKLSLDDPITRYFPELPAPVYGRVTVDHLIHHTGGVRDYWPLAELTGRAVEDGMTEQGFLDLMARQKQLNFAPGLKFDYTNSGYVLLAILVERVSGKALPAFAAENIFKPLGMTHTFFRDDPTVVIPMRARGYSLENGAYREHPTRSRLIGDGGVMTTVEDLFLWDQNFYHNKVGKGSAGLIRLVETPGKTSDGKQTDYAFGLALSEYNGTKKITHSGSGFGYTADMTQFPDRKFSVICLCNSDAPDVQPWTFRNQIADIYLGASPKTETGNSVSKTPPIRLDETILKRLAGAYRDTGDGEVWKISAENGGLLARVEGIEFRLEPLAPTHFRAVDAPQAVDLFFPENKTAGQGRIRLQVGSQPPSFLEPFAVWSPSGVELPDYAGDYYSEEMDTIIHLAGSNGSLKATRNRKIEILAPGDQKDKFEMGRFKLLFERDNSGKITGFTAGDGRITGIRFVRQL